MKKFFVVMMVMAFVCGALAQERQLLKVEVPFSFTAGNTGFPAGSYTVYLLDPMNLVRVQSLDRGPVAMMRGWPSYKSSDGKTELVFQRIDGQFFLTEVHESDNSIQRTLPLGKVAKELEARRHGGPKVDGVVAIAAH